MTNKTKRHGNACGFQKRIEVEKQIYWLDEPSDIEHVYWQKELEEIFGPLNWVKETEGGILAEIGETTVFLPVDMSEALGGLIGERIGVFRCDGYHLRILEDDLAGITCAAHEKGKRSKPLSAEVMSNVAATA